MLERMWAVFGKRIRISPLLRQKPSGLCRICSWWPTEWAAIRPADYASRFIVEQVNKNLKELPEGTKPVAALKRAIEQANADLYSESLKDPEKEGMGSTLVAVTMADQRCILPMWATAVFIFCGTT